MKKIAPGFLRLVQNSPGDVREMSGKLPYIPENSPGEF